MGRPALAFACLLTVATSSRAASPDPADLLATPEVQVKCRALVRQLGSELYDEREDAQQQLADLGRLARPALLAGVNTSPDPEIRTRCAQLLPKANALDLKAKLDTFLADSDGRYEHDLAAWKTFRAVVCNEWSFCGHTLWSDRELEKTARQVFVEMLASHANRRLLLAVDGSRLELTELVVARKLEFYDQRGFRGSYDIGRDPTLEEMGALLFADSRVGSQYIPRRGGSITFMLSGSGFTSAARGRDDKGRVYRAIAAAWLDSRNEPREMSSAMSLAVSLDLPDQAAGLAARLFSMPGVTTLVRGRAVSNLLSYGNKKHVRMLDKALADTVVLSSVRPATPAGAESTYDIQVRDVALGISLLLTGQKLADYGFSDRYEGTAGFDDRDYMHTRYYFAGEEARKKALAKWAEWRKAHPNG